MMKRRNIGVIDIGSNSVHLVVGEYYNNEYFKIIDDAKVNVRLSEGLAETGDLQDDRMDYGIETLLMFKKMIEAYSIQKTIAVATAAIRKANNGKEYVNRIRKKTGIKVDIIPGEKEALLDYLGAINTLDVKDALLMDIGGGSTEFVLIKDRKKCDIISLNFGSFDLMEKFDLGDRPSEKSIKKLKAFLKKTFESEAIFNEMKAIPIIGVGGTIRNIGRIYRNLVNDPLEIAHNYKMTFKEVKKVCDLAAKLNNEQRMDLKGLSKGRSDIFVGAAYALEQLMAYTESKELIISNAGLRDGIIYDYFGYNEDNLVYDIFEMSLVDVLMNYNVNIPHAYHVLKLSKIMFEQLKDLHGITDDVSKILKTAAMLHDSGIKIQYDNHHEHSFYIILNAGIMGIEQKDLLLSAFIALNHRTNKKIKISDEYEVLLQEEEKIFIDKMSVFLQIAEYLDRSMDGVVKDINCVIKKNEVELQVFTDMHLVFGDMVVSECGKKFKRVFGKELVVKNKN